MITIGQLARYSGVTIKAVRHYYKAGLLAEPARDVSGYRRYTAQDAIDLVKIRTLAEAGVPLARVKELLVAGEDSSPRRSPRSTRRCAGGKRRSGSPVNGLCGRGRATRCS